MEVKQIADMLNTINREVMGEEAIQTEDLSNIVDIGRAIYDANAKDPFCKALVNQIGKMVFVNRKYSGGAPSVLMDGWEYGSILSKVSTDLPDVEVNESWEIESGASFDCQVFYGSVVSQRFWNKRITFEIPKSFTEKQLKQSFTSAMQFNGFVSMLYTSVENALTISIDNLIMRTINGAIAESVNGGKVVDILDVYNTTKGTSLTPEVALITEDFLKFATYTIGLYADRMSKISTAFNIGGKQRFTPADRRNVVLLSDFAKAIGPYTLAGAYNKGELEMPEFETVPFWQGSGAGTYALDKVSSIDVELPSDGTTAVNQEYIIGVMFDRDALGVCNVDRRVTTAWNPKAEFTTNWYKFDAQYFNDLNENVLVFTIEGGS